MLYIVTCAVLSPMVLTKVMHFWGSKNVKNLLCVKHMTNGKSVAGITAGSLYMDHYKVPTGFIARSL